MAARFGVGLGTVQRALERAGNQALAEVDWADRSTAPHRTRRIPSPIETLVLETRRQLAADILGEQGAEAIWRALTAQGVTPTPSVRTIGRILERRGVLDGHRRVRRPAPPPGWYLPEVARREVELDAFDAIVGLTMFGGAEVEVFTGISLHGGLAAAWPGEAAISPFVTSCLLEHWRSVGLPGFAQFDNDTRFLGSHAQPDVLGRVPRLCLALGVTPVFAPIREHGFQNQIESFNGLWQARVWKRAFGLDLDGLAAFSARYIAAHRTRRASRIEGAPERAPFELPPSRPGRPRGRIIFIRRTSLAGRVDILGRLYEVDPHWPLRLVRAELDLDALVIRFHALRRREPTDQPLLVELPYRLPARSWVTRTY